MYLASRAMPAEVYNVWLMRAVLTNDAAAIRSVLHLQRIFPLGDHFQWCITTDIFGGVGLIVSYEYGTERIGTKMPLCTVEYAKKKGLLNIYHAVALNDAELVAKRVQLGDDPNAGHGSDKPLIRALNDECTAMIRILLAFGADPDVMEHCQTAYHAQMLLAHGASCRHDCVRWRIPATMTMVLHLAGGKPCGPVCRLNWFEGIVLPLQRHCSNVIRRHRLDTRVLPQMLAEAVLAFDL